MSEVKVRRQEPRADGSGTAERLTNPEAGSSHLQHGAHDQQRADLDGGHEKDAEPIRRYCAVNAARNRKGASVE